MVYITYKDNGDSDINEVTSYFYNEEDAKEYAELMGQEYMTIPHISREYWPEKIKYIYCTAWPYNNNNIKIDSREYEVLSNEIGAIKTELLISFTQISKCFFSTKEEAEKEFYQIVSEYKIVLRPNQYGNLVFQMVRKDTEGLICKIVNEKECWGNEDDWNKYEEYKASQTTTRSSGPMFSGNFGAVMSFAPVPITFTDFYANLNTGAVDRVTLTGGTNEQQ